MELESWLNARGGIATRLAARDAGFGRGELARWALGRRWLATPQADVQLRAAASHLGRLACVSAARHRGLALLSAPDQLHVAVPRNAPIQHDERLRFHTSRPLAACRHDLIESVPDMLEHAAVCLPPREAFAVWESALRTRLLTLHELRATPWRRPASRRLAACAGTRSDSILESLAAWELRERGIAFVQQARLLGRPVDFLIEGRLVLQVDGYEFHADARQRREDIDFDARLELEGLPVLRRDYVQVVHEMPTTVDLVLRRLALAGVRS